jgi:BlaI family penicillinase repressor
MPRPRNENPTPAELEVLKILWDGGPMTVRDVMEVFRGRKRRRAYTSVMSLMNVMTEKGLLTRKPQGRAFVYTAKLARERTLSTLVGDLWERAFEGSASSLVTHLLEQTNPTSEELDEIRKAIESYRNEQGETR